jgi:uncharacterized protein involved in propanediol utilization
MTSERLTPAGALEAVDLQQPPNDQLRRLDAELLNAWKRVSEAIQTEQPGHSLEGEALAR